jgi:hypothetical protein
MLAINGKLGNLALLFLIFVSIFGLILSILFVINPPKSQDDFALRKPAIGSALGVVCVLGILAVLYPDSCSGILDFKKRDKYLHSFRRSRILALRGHHPTCEPYSTHVIKIGDRRLCATCSGLFIGTIIVLVGIGLFFFENLRIGEKPFIPVSVGVVGVMLGLLYPVVPRFHNGFTRFFASILFVVGSFLILAIMEEVANSTSIDLFFVTLSVLWLATKISLSQWEHQRTCARCSLGSCNALK